MANQPPPVARPFFRLGSLSRPAPPPPPTPAVQPPPLARPTFTVPFRPQPTQPQQPTPPPPPPPAAATSASVPTSPIPRTFAPFSSMPTFPAPKPAPYSTMAPLVTSSSSVPSSPNKPNIISASSSSLPTSPPPSLPTLLTAKDTATDAAAFATTRVATPTQSPKIIKSSAPLALPPSQLKSVPEPEPKIRLQVFDPKNVTKDVVEAKEKGSHEKKFSDSKWGGARAITIAGENKGAFMELGLSHKQHDAERSLHGVGVHENNKTLRAFINSNVQGVNNSILLDCSCTQHDPGVHVNLSTKPTADRVIHLKDHANGHHT